MVDRNQSTKRLWGQFTTSEGMRLYVPPSDFLKLNSIPRVVDPFDSGTTQLYPLGTKLEYAERVFRYSKMGGTAGAVGKLYQSVVPLAGHKDEVITYPAIGATTISFTPAVVTTDDLAADELADGYLFTNGTEAGLGQMYRIKSHPAIVGAVVGVITLYDPIRVAPGTSQTGTVLHNKYRNVIIHDSPPTAELVGVCINTLAANAFGWLQTQGPCAVLTQGTLVIGDFCVPSATVDGAVMPSAAFETDGPYVGKVMIILADADYSAIFLQLE